MLDLTAVKQVDLLALVQASGIELDKASSREHSGPCPKCGGTDRFHVHEDKGWFCRNCTGDPATGHWHDALDFVMWRDGVDFIEAYRRLGGGGTLSAKEREQLKAQREQRDEDRRQQDKAERAKARAELDQSGIAKAYYANLDKLDKRGEWYKRGLMDLWQDYFRVGYNPVREFHSGDKTFVAASLTIPTWQPAITDDGDLSWACTALVHRLLNDKAPGGKYRPERAGLGKPVFRCDLYSSTIDGPVLLVEGEIKAMVTWSHMQDYISQDHPTGTVGRLTVAGISGKSLSQEQADELKTAGDIWICLDPDARQDAERAARMLGIERCRIIDLPGKVDDMLVDGSLEAWQFKSLLDRARRVK